MNNLETVNYNPELNNTQPENVVESLGHQATQESLDILIDVLGVPVENLGIPTDVALALTGTKMSTVGPHEENE